MSNMMYDLGRNQMVRRLNEYQVMDMRGYIHDIQQIDDHWIMDIRTGRLHYVRNEVEPEEIRRQQAKNTMPTEITAFGFFCAFAFLLVIVFAILIMSQ